MGNGENQYGGREWYGLLAGLANSVIASLALLAWLGCASRSSLFTFPIVSSLALQVALYGTVGAWFGLALAGRAGVPGFGCYYSSFLGRLPRNLEPAERQLRV